MTGPFKLAPLPWNEYDLEPTICARTIGFHYHKHHKTYVETLNKLVKGTKYADMQLERVVRDTHAAATVRTRRRFSTMPARSGTTISTGAR